jgi:hypothetical protein
LAHGLINRRIGELSTAICPASGEAPKQAL